MAFAKLMSLHFTKDYMGFARLSIHVLVISNIMSSELNFSPHK